jgi:hypothetical protein
MTPLFTYTFLAIILATLALFGVAEALPKHRNTLAAIAAVAEGVVFLMLAHLFYLTPWGGVSSGFMAALPAAGAGFAFRMAYKRLRGLPL